MRASGFASNHLGEQPVIGVSIQLIKHGGSLAYHLIEHFSDPRQPFAVRALQA
jgi:hypothetical protein